MKKKYRFFFHYNKPHKLITVHFKNTCYLVKDIVCEVATESKWNKTQPHLIIRGKCSNLLIKSEIAYII